MSLLNYECSWVSDFDHIFLLPLNSEQKNTTAMTSADTDDSQVSIPTWGLSWTHHSYIQMDSSMGRLHRNFKLFISKISYWCLLPPAVCLHPFCLFVLPVSLIHSTVQPDSKPLTSVYGKSWVSLTFLSVTPLLKGTCRGCDSGKLLTTQSHSCSLYNLNSQNKVPSVSYFWNVWSI